MIKFKIIKLKGYQFTILIIIICTMFQIKMTKKIIGHLIRFTIRQCGTNWADLDI